MDASQMTAEQLMQLAEEKGLADESARYREAVVDGFRLRVDLVKAASWTAFRKSGRIDYKNPTFDIIDKVFDLIEYVSDATEESIVAFCGGDDAARDDVLRLAVKISNEVWQKK